MESQNDSQATNVCGLLPEIIKAPTITATTMGKNEDT